MRRRDAMGWLAACLIAVPGFVAAPDA